MKTKNRFPARTGLDRFRGPSITITRSRKAKANKVKEPGQPGQAGVVWLSGCLAVRVLAKAPFLPPVVLRAGSAASCLAAS